MLDTVTCVRVMRDAAPRLVGRFNRHAHELCISTITLAELHHGAEKSLRVARNLGAIANFTSRLAAVLDFDAAAAAEYGRLKVALAKQPIGPVDTMIAAHASSRGLMVITANLREFRRVPNLQVENWLD